MTVGCEVTQPVILLVAVWIMTAERNERCPLNPTVVHSTPQTAAAATAGALHSSLTDLAHQFSCSLRRQQNLCCHHASVASSASVELQDHWSCSDPGVTQQQFSVSHGTKSSFDSNFPLKLQVLYSLRGFNFCFHPQVSNNQA